MKSNVTLWGLAASPYVRKVIIALNEKEVEYNLIEIPPAIILKATGQPIPEDFSKASPLGKIPAIKIDEVSLSDSAVINQYIDLKFNNGQVLYPKDIQASVEARWFEMYADVELTAVIYKKIFMEKIVKPLIKQNTDELIYQTALEQELPPLLDFLNSNLVGKTWFVRNEFSVADIAIGVQLLALEMTGYTFKSEQFPHVKEFLNRLKERKSLLFLHTS